MSRGLEELEEEDCSIGLRGMLAAVLAKKSNPTN